VIENKRGSVVVFGLMLGMVVIILALALAPAVAEFTNNARATVTGMNCAYTNNISTFVRAACVATDMSLFYFIAFLIFLGGAVVTAKFAFGGKQE